MRGRWIAVCEDVPSQIRSNGLPGRTFDTPTDPFGATSLGEGGRRLSFVCSSIRGTHWAGGTLSCLRAASYRGLVVGCDSRTGGRRFGDYLRPLDFAPLLF